MRIGIDARFYGPTGKGLGRYIQKLIEYLEKVDSENEYFVFLRKENFSRFQPKNPNFKKVLADIPWYSWQEHIFMPRKIREVGVDLMHFPHFNVPLFYFGPYVVTIHDLTVSRFPTRRATTHGWAKYLFKRLAYKLVIRLAIWRAKKIIAVSQFTKNEIERYSRIDPGKIVVVYEAADSERRALSERSDLSRCLEKFKIKGPYLLYVGHAYPHKNLERLIKAFQLIKAKLDLQLVLVGKIDYFYQRLKDMAEKLGLTQKADVIFTGYLEDDELETLYQKATCFVFPSLSEGFGLPPLEAMARGTPVASSSHGSLPEVLGDAACYFDPEDARDMARVMSQAVEKKELREILIKKGYQQVAKFSWRKSAKDSLKVYQNAV